MTDRTIPISAARPERGFFRYDLYILVALLGLTLAVVVPQAHRHGLKGALVALGGLIGVLGGGLGLLIGGSWLLDQKARAGWGARLLQGLGDLLRFGLFGLVASIVGTALVVGHGWPPGAVDGVSLAAGMLGGLGGVWLYQSLGAERFWPAFGLLGLALLGSLLGGLLGLLDPGPWGVDLGVLIPLLAFGALLAAGKIMPPGPGRPVR